MGGVLGDVKDGVSLLKDVVSLASSVLILGGTLYDPSDSLQEFEENVAELQRTCEFWQNNARNYGLSSDPVLRSSLQRAEKQLQHEEARLKNLDRRCGVLWLWLFCSSGTDFPAHLGKSIVNLDKKITNKWNAEDDADDAMRKRAGVVRSSTFAFKEDRRYVRLPVIEEQLKKALSNDGSGDETARVVLLYGRAGSGKSCMARNLALDFKQAVACAADRRASSSANGCPFDNIFFLECGPEADLEAKQVELLRMVDWRFSDTEKQKDKDSKNVVKATLKQRLKDSRSLIIFDDVWKESFFQGMVAVCGNHMKILVTSQEKYVCGPSFRPLGSGEMKSFSMDQITKEDSFRILRFHTGFDDKESISEAVKKCMEDLVIKVDGHPHALASIAVAIDQEHKDEEWQWENAVREYDELLNKPLSKVVNPIQGVPYVRSFTEAIQMKFKRLEVEEKKLLVLMAMLREPSIEEEILRLFHAEIIASNKSEGIRSCSSFSKARKNLENLQCIKTNKYKDPRDLYLDEQRSSQSKFEIEGLSWSIHSLDEQFIQERMGNDVTAMLEAVKDLSKKEQGLKPEPQVNVIQLLGLLVFKDSFRKEIEESLHLSRRYFDLKQSGLLPIIHLMVKNIGKGWSKTSQQSSDQIFRSCVAEGVLHNDAAKELLNSSVSKKQVWILMTGFYWWGEWSIDEDVIFGVLRIFGDLRLPMDSSVIGSLNLDQRNTLLVLVSRYGLHPARSCVFQMREVVLGLANMLASPCYPPDIEHLSAVVLSYLVPLMYDKPSEYGEEGFASIPNIIKALFQSIQETSKREVRWEAALALNTLAYHSRTYFDVKQKMIRIGFHQLVGYLGREKDEHLNEVAFATLRRLVVVDFERSYLKCSHINGSAIEDLGNYVTAKVGAAEFAGTDFDDSQLGEYVEVLTLIDPARGTNMILNSYRTLLGRGKALVRLGQYEDSLRDLQQARQLNPRGFYRLDGLGALRSARRRLKDWEGLVKDCDHEVWRLKEDGSRVAAMVRAYLMRGRAKRLMGDLPGALEDFNRSIQLDPDLRFLELIQRGYVKFLMGDQEGARADVEEVAYRLALDAGQEAFFYQERGVFKRLTGDFPGALQDFDKGLQLGPNDYETLKQRGYVKFLMGDEEGARADAEEALRFRPRDDPFFDHDQCLGTSIVEFLDFRL